MRKHIQVHYQSDPHDPLLSGTSSPFLQAGPNALFSNVNACNAYFPASSTCRAKIANNSNVELGGLAMVRRHSAMPLNSEWTESGL